MVGTPFFYPCRSIGDKDGAFVRGNSIGTTYQLIFMRLCVFVYFMLSLQAKNPRVS
jgi:hypothetical protein